jgi:hypothetical protein
MLQTVIAALMVGATGAQAAVPVVANLAVMSDDPAYQAYQQHLQREAATIQAQATQAQNAARPTPAKPESLIRVIPLDAEASNAAPNASNRFIFTRVTPTSPSGQAEEASRASQVERLRQQVAGEKTP